MSEMTVATISSVRSCLDVNAPSGTLFPVLLELPGIKENRVDEVAAVATHPVMNPTPAITWPATKAEGEEAMLKIQIPPITVSAATK
jgi:hypothetical protein